MNTSDKDSESLSDKNENTENTIDKEGLDSESNDQTQDESPDETGTNTDHNTLHHTLSMM